MSSSVWDKLSVCSSKHRVLYKHEKTMMRVCKGWTEEDRIGRILDSGMSNMTSPWYINYLICIMMLERTAFLLEFSKRLGTDAGVLFSSSRIHWRLLIHQLNLRMRITLRRISLRLKHRPVHLQWAFLKYPVVGWLVTGFFLRLFRYYLDYNDGRILISRYRGKRLLPECLIQHYTLQKHVIYGRLSYEISYSKLNGL